MKDKDYGGAWDVNPNEYWTKDDLMELKAAVEELSKEYDLTISEIYLDENDVLDITYTDRHENEWQLQEDIQLNPNVAGTCKEMCEFYASKVNNAMVKEYLDFEEELRQEQIDEWENY